MMPSVRSCHGAKKIVVILIASLTTLAAASSHSSGGYGDGEYGDYEGAEGSETPPPTPPPTTATEEVFDIVMEIDFANLKLDELTTGLAESVGLPESEVEIEVVYELGFTLSFEGDDLTVDQVKSSVGSVLSIAESTFTVTQSRRLGNKAADGKERQLAAVDYDVTVFTSDSSAATSMVEASENTEAMTSALVTTMQAMSLSVTVTASEVTQTVTVTVTAAVPASGSVSLSQDLLAQTVSGMGGIVKSMTQGGAAVVLEPTPPPTPATPATASGANCVSLAKALMFVAAAAALPAFH